MNGQTGRNLAKKVVLALSAGMIGIVPSAYALPNQGTHNNASVAAITKSGNTMTIVGKGNNNIINWNDYSIANGETVNYNDTSNYLNIVNGATKSNINGEIKGGNNVYLLNQNGILFGSTAHVHVGGQFVASTAPISDAQKEEFAANGVISTVDATGAVNDIVNHGTLDATSVALIGNEIVIGNAANIVPTKSSVVLAANGDIDIGHTADIVPAGKTIADFAKNNPKKAGKNMSGYTVKSGHVNDCVLIGSADELKSMIASGNYMLSQDIDLSGQKDFQINTFQGSGDIGFGACLDGAGYAIKNLTSTKGGLFGTLKNGVSIKNLKIENASVDANTKYVGILSNQLNYNVAIKNVDVVGGHITNTDTNGTGGLVGNASTKDANHAITIDHVSNSAAVTSAQGVGGILGKSEANGPEVHITNAVNTGTITATTNGYIGGIAGQLNAGTVSYAYNSGKIVSTTNNTGGIVGAANGAGISVSYAVNAGDMSETKNASGIIGGVKSDTVISHAVDAASKSGSSYYAIVGTSTAPTIEDAITTGGYVDTNHWTKGTPTKVSASTAMKASTYAGWGDSGVDAAGNDNSKAWRIYEGKTAPMLKAFMTTVDAPTYEKTYNGTAQTVENVEIDGASSTLKFVEADGYKTGYTNAGTYTLGSFYDTSATGYNIVGDATLTMKKAPLVVDAADTTMVYGNPGSVKLKMDASNVSGTIYTDADKALISAALEKDNALTPDLSAAMDGNRTKDVGVYDLKVAYNGEPLQNYEFVAGAEGKTAHITITKAPLKVTLSDVSTTYGTAFDSNAYAKGVKAEGLTNGDTLADVVGTLTFENGALSPVAGHVTNDVGTYAYSLSNANNKSNYEFTADSSLTGTANVKKAVLDFSGAKLAPKTSVYGVAFDDTVDSDNKLVSGIKGLTNGDDITSLGLTYTNNAADVDAAGQAAYQAVQDRIDAGETVLDTEVAAAANYRQTKAVGDYDFYATIPTLSNYEIVGTDGTLMSNATVTPATLYYKADKKTVENGWVTKHGYYAHNANGLEIPFSGQFINFTNGDTPDTISAGMLTFNTGDSVPSRKGSYVLYGDVAAGTRVGNYSLMQKSDPAYMPLTVIDPVSLSMDQEPVMNQVLASESQAADLVPQAAGITKVAMPLAGSPIATQGAAMPENGSVTPDASSATKATVAEGVDVSNTAEAGVKEDRTSGVGGEATAVETTSNTMAVSDQGTSSEGDDEK